MKRFHFRLETALRIRNMAEQQAQAALADAERGVLVAEQRLTQALEERERHLTYYARLQELPKPDLALLTASCQYTELLDEQLEQRRAEVRAAIDLRETRLSVLQEKRRDRELLDKLKEKKLQEHQLQEAAEEQTWLDEVAVLRVGRA